MTTERIKEIQSKTSYPESVSVQQALLQVWNEVEQEQLQLQIVSSSCRHDYNYKILFDHTAVAVCSKCKKRIKA